MRNFDRNGKNLLTLSGRLRRIKEIIDSVENRCMTSDIVTNTRHEMTDKELQEIYELAAGRTIASINKEIEKRAKKVGVIAARSG